MYIVQKHLENIKKAQLPGKVVVIYGACCTAAYPGNLAAHKP